MSSQSPRKARSTTSYLSVPPTVSPVSSTDDNVSPLLPPFVQRPSMSRHSTTRSHSNSQNRSDLLTPQTSVADVNHTRPFKLLLPTVRPSRNSPPSSTIASAKSSPAKYSRSKAGSSAPSLQTSPDPSSLLPMSVDWIGGGRRFEVVQDQLELEGFQLYAVEKW